MNRLNKTRKLISILIAFFLTGFFLTISCTSHQSTLTKDHLIRAHYLTLANAEAHQEYFRKNIKPKMSKEQVKELAIRTSQNNPGDYYTNGEPANSTFKVIDDNTYEVWEYSYYSKIFVLTFQNNQLIRFDEKKGVTALDNM